MKYIRLKIPLTETTTLHQKKRRKKKRKRSNDRRQKEQAVKNKETILTKIRPVTDGEKKIKKGIKSAYFFFFFLLFSLAFCFLFLFSSFNFILFSPFLCVYWGGGGEWDGGGGGDFLYPSPVLFW